MKIMYVICGLRNENERDFRSNEHFLSSGENMASRKFRPVRDFKIEAKIAFIFNILLVTSFRKIS